MAESRSARALERLIRERGEDYAGLSRLIGRNPAYVQQYIKRGTPRRLAEEDRRLLARYFGHRRGFARAVRPPSRRGAGLVASAARCRRVGRSGRARRGGAALEARSPSTVVAAAARPGGGRPGRLSLIRVEGDSMAPTLSDGDEILVDGGDGASRLRDGIYVLRIEDALVVKRLALGPAAGLGAQRQRGLSRLARLRPFATRIDLVGRVVWVRAFWRR
jgi:hypothetical protein